MLLVQQLKDVGHLIVSANPSEKTNLWRQQCKYTAHSTRKLFCQKAAVLWGGEGCDGWMDGTQQCSASHRQVFPQSQKALVLNQPAALFLL